MSKQKLPLHLQGAAVARYDPWYVAWHSPRPGLLLLGFDDPPKEFSVVIDDLDELTARFYLVAFGLEEPVLFHGARVTHAVFVSAVLTSGTLM